MRKTTVIFCAVAIACLLFGAARGEAGMVLQKGIKLCLECVGIG